MHCDRTPGIAVLTAAMVLILLCAGSCSAQTQEGSLRPALIVGSIGDVVLDRDGCYLYATGEGAVPPESGEPNRAKAYLKAKGYTRMEAVALLLAAYLTITDESIGLNDYLPVRISGYLRNVEIVSDWVKYGEDGTLVQVIVRVPAWSAQP